MRTLAFTICSALLLRAAEPTPVKVEVGQVQGVVEGDLTVYKGIPFAAPPTGDLRWRAPQPAPKWEGVRSADKFAPGCMQSMGSPPLSGMSEDCLNLNVWTPAKSAKDRIGRPSSRNMVRGRFITTTSISTRSIRQVLRKRDRALRTAPRLRTCLEA
jgi:hypothetical protein